MSPSSPGHAFLMRAHPSELSFIIVSTRPQHMSRFIVATPKRTWMHRGWCVFLSRHKFPVPRPFVSFSFFSKDVAAFTLPVPSFVVHPENKNANSRAPESESASVASIALQRDEKFIKNLMECRLLILLGWTIFWQASSPPCSEDGSPHDGRKRERPRAGLSFYLTKQMALLAIISKGCDICAPSWSKQLGRAALDVDRMCQIIKKKILRKKALKGANRLVCRLGPGSSFAHKQLRAEPKGLVERITCEAAKVNAPCKISKGTRLRNYGKCFKHGRTNSSPLVAREDAFRGG